MKHALQSFYVTLIIFIHYFSVHDIFMAKLQYQEPIHINSIQKPKWKTLWPEPSPTISKELAINLTK